MDGWRITSQLIYKMLSVGLRTYKILCPRTSLHKNLPIYWRTRKIQFHRRNGWTRTHDEIWEERTYVSIAKNLGYLATNVWVKGRYISSKYFQIAVRKMNWNKNMMENYIVQNWNNCHKEQLFLPSQEFPPSILSRSGEVSQGQHAIALIDGGATHNFIGASWVERKIFPIEDFEGFTVVMASNHRMKCTQRIP